MKEDKVVWVLQDTEVRVDKVMELVEALNSNNIEFVTVGLRFFEDELSMTPIATDIPVIFYGTTKLVRIISTQHPQYKPGVFYCEENFNYPKWVEKFGIAMLNYDAHIVQATSFVPQVWTDDEPRFIRPFGDLKAFKGSLVEKWEYEKWISDASGGFHHFGPEQKMVIAEAKNIKREWRFVVVNHKVIAGSQYQKDHQLNIDPLIEQKVWDQANIFAQEWMPADVVVMDIAETYTGWFKIIEFNTFNGAGFYACNHSEIVRQVTDFVKNKSAQAN
jgi:hypothetical protein